MNFENSKTSHPQRLLLNLTESYLSIYNTWKNIKKSYKNKKFEISARTWNEEFEPPDGSYSISDIPGYSGYILKKTWEKTVNLSIRIYINKIENRVTFKVQTRYYLKLLTPETKKLLGSTKSQIMKDENGKNVPHLEITEVI